MSRARRQDWRSDSRSRESDARLYRTQMCTHGPGCWLRAQRRCLFAHSREELRPLPMCQKRENCPGAGRWCRFRHPLPPPPHEDRELAIALQKSMQTLQEEEAVRAAMQLPEPRVGECPICYDTATHVLACGHRFCKSCAECSISFEHCPVCRQPASRAPPTLSAHKP